MARKPNSPHKLGLRVTVRLHGAVVGQAVRWRSWLGPVTIGDAPDAVIPTASGAPLAVVRWESSQAVLITCSEPGVEPARIGHGETWHWAGPGGVDVDCDLVPYQRAQRFGAVGGDLALLTLMLAMMVGVAQANLLLRSFLPPSSAGSQGYEASPELIARLLSRDLDGEEQGVPERAERPDMARGNPSFYMPAGNDGALTRIGGGEVVGKTVQRRDEPDLDDSPEQGMDELAPQLLPESAEIDPDGPPVDGITSQDVQALTDAGAEGGAEGPMERFVGWGFRDWFDSSDNRALDPDMERQLNRARTRLRLDPDDPSAIQVVGYYSYLAEKNDVCREAYQRYTELYPEDPAGFNNLALTYKRAGDYPTEEALYRKALDLDPFDPHVLNNLAVNLAHQGRSAEALAIMDQLEELTPGDPYAELHRAKIYATMGKRERAYRSLTRALESVAALDTMHHIEFRQDIRLDPSFEAMRGDARMERLLARYYDDAAYLVAGPDGRNRSVAGDSRG
jgi:Flp pilus assembly protein TadD